MKTHLLAASATLAATLVTTLSAVPAAAACAVPTTALQYLAANQLADGSLDMSSAGGFGNPTATEDMAIGAAANGYDPNTIKKGGKSPYDYLAANVGAATSDVGRASKLILALAAGNVPAGRYDYDNFGGAHPLTVVTAAYHPGTGAYGDGSAFGQSLAILAVKASGQAPPALALTWLEGIRNTGKTSGGYSGELATDTGWSYGNAADQYQADTNTTSEALQALDAAGDHSQDAGALAFLHSQQNSDGGFPLEKPSSFGTASDADSDALVLEALAASGQTLAAWTVSGQSPLTNLLSMQDPATGGFSSPTPDTFTTSQVPQGLARVAGPVGAPATEKALPAAGCPLALATTPASTAGTVTPSPAAPALPRAGGRPAEPPTGWGLLAAAVVLAGGTGAALARRRD